MLVCLYGTVRIPTQCYCFKIIFCRHVETSNLDILFLQWCYILSDLLQVTIFLHFLWVAPLQAIAVIALLWYEIGPSCLAGIAVLLILMPTQTIFGKWFSVLRYDSSTDLFLNILIFMYATGSNSWLCIFLNAYLKSDFVLNLLKHIWF